MLAFEIRSQMMLAIPAWTLNNIGALNIRRARTSGPQYPTSNCFIQLKKKCEPFFVALFVGTPSSISTQQRRRSFNHQERCFFILFNSNGS